MLVCKPELLCLLVCGPNVDGTSPIAQEHPERKVKMWFVRGVQAFPESCQLYYKNY